MNASIQKQGGTDRVTPRIVASNRTATIFDGQLPEAPTADWFDAEWWRSRGQVRQAGAGRGGAVFVDTPEGTCVLRHYRRGGWMAPLLGDRYLWGGRDRSRGFAEFKLLGELLARGLPVPAPVAARCRRRGAYYTADLLTRAIPDAVTLAEAVRSGAFDTGMAERVGMLVARFHAQGVDHADLNAHNILLAAGQLWLIDFDRGEIRVTGTAWRLANLARLKRSLLKVGACNGDDRVLDREIWPALMRGYGRGADDGR